MSFAPRSIARACGSVSKRRAIQQQRLSSSSPSSSTAPPLIASLLLSRPPLLTPTPSEFEAAYQEHSRAVEHSLSSPLPTEFYFKSGSLPLRRFLQSEHEYTARIYGDRLGGSKPEVGDIPPETEYEVLPRNHWEEQDRKRGEKSLERYPEQEVFCLVKDKSGGKWNFPQVEVGRLEGLDQAVQRGITGVEGSLGGKGMDSWLVTRKPVGVVRSGEQRTFFIRGHILAGEPSLSSSSPYTTWAWLNTSEVETKLREQGDEKVWKALKGMFGVATDEDLD